MVNNSQLAIKTNLPRSIKKTPSPQQTLSGELFHMNETRSHSARILSDPLGFIVTETLSLQRVGDEIFQFPAAARCNKSQNASFILK
jgi:hypothetical protein